MSRPLRIEYPGAWYHIINRSADTKNLMPSDSLRQQYWRLLQEITSIFGVEIHGYCLLPQQQHLILHTPQGNLSRAMRHLNGIYTQSYNREKSASGPIYYGRYKTVLFDPDTYLSDISTYLHVQARNALSATKSKKAAQFILSSEASYTGKHSELDDLHTDVVLHQFGLRGQKNKYAKHMAKATIANATIPYENGRFPSLLGEPKFRDQVHNYLNGNNRKAPAFKQLHTIRKTTKKSKSTKPLTISVITNATAKAFNKKPKDLLTVKRGRGSGSIERYVAIYLCREVAAYRIEDIAKHFGLSHYSSVSHTLKRVRQATASDSKTLKMVEKLTIDLRAKQ